eukprot:m.93567 g.93567  ORF g.93567 m.93567 type:complete len:1555 (-) comp8915_c0_seq1:287-4951(-)
MEAVVQRCLLKAILSVVTPRKEDMSLSTLQSSSTSSVKASTSFFPKKKKQKAIPCSVENLRLYPSHIAEDSFVVESNALETLFHFLVSRGLIAKCGDDEDGTTNSKHKDESTIDGDAIDTFIEDLASALNKDEHVGGTQVVAGQINFIFTQSRKKPSSTVVKDSQRKMVDVRALVLAFSKGIAPLISAKMKIAHQHICRKVKAPHPTSWLQLAVDNCEKSRASTPHLVVKNDTIMAWLKEILIFYTPPSDGFDFTNHLHEINGILNTNAMLWPSDPVEIAKLFVSGSSYFCNALTKLPPYSILELLLRFQPLFDNALETDVSFIQHALSKHAHNQLTIPSNIFDQIAEALLRILGVLCLNHPDFKALLEDLTMKISLLKGRHAKLASSSTSSSMPTASKLLDSLKLQSSTLDVLLTAEANKLDIHAMFTQAGAKPPQRMSTRVLDVLKRVQFRLADQILDIQQQGLPDRKTSSLPLLRHHDSNDSPISPLARFNFPSSINSSSSSPSQPQAEYLYAINANTPIQSLPSRRDGISTTPYAQRVYFADGSFQQYDSTFLSQRTKRNLDTLPSSSSSSTPSAHIQSLPELNDIGEPVAKKAHIIIRPQQHGLKGYERLSEMQITNEGATTSDHDDDGDNIDDDNDNDEVEEIIEKGNEVMSTGVRQGVINPSFPHASQSTYLQIPHVSSIIPSQEQQHQPTAFDLPTSTLRDHARISNEHKNGPFDQPPNYHEYMAVQMKSPQQQQSPRRGVSKGDYLSLLQLAGNAVEEAEFELQSTWKNDACLLSGICFEISHMEFMWCVQLNATVSDSTAIANQVANKLNISLDLDRNNIGFTNSVPSFHETSKSTRFLGSWYNDCRLVTNQPTRVTLYFSTIRNFASPTFFSYAKNIIVHLPLVATNNDLYMASNSRSATAGNRTRANKSTVFAGRKPLASSSLVQQASTPSNTTAATSSMSSMITVDDTPPVMMPINSGDVSGKDAALDAMSALEIAIKVEQIPERFTFASICSHQPNNDAIKKNLLIGSKCIVAVHSTNHNTFVSSIANFEAQTAYSSIIARVKKQSTTDTFMICRDLGEKSFVVLDDTTTDPLPWEQQLTTSGAKVLHVFLQPRIYAQYLPSDLIAPMRSAILFCDNIPRSDVLLAFLSQRSLALRSFSTFSHTMELVGTEGAIVKALQEYKDNPFPVRNSFGNSASLSSSIYLEILLKKNTFHLSVPRFIKPHNLLRQLSLILTSESDTIIAHIQRISSLGVTTTLLQSGMYHEISHFCPLNQGRVVVAFDEAESAELLQLPFSSAELDSMGGFLQRHSANGPSLLPSTTKAMTSVTLSQTTTSQSPSPSNVLRSIPNLPSLSGRNGLKILTKSDVLMLPQLNFESYVKRCLRIHGEVGKEYVSAVEQHRLAYAEKEVNLQRFMLPGKKVRIAMIDICTSLGFSQEAITFLLAERDRVLDAQRKAKTRQNLRERAKVIHNQITSTLDMLQTSSSPTPNIDRGLMEDKLQQLLTTLFNAPEGLKLEFKKVDKEKKLNYAEKYIKKHVSHANIRNTSKSSFGPSSTKGALK